MSKTRASVGRQATRFAERVDRIASVLADMADKGIDGQALIDRAKALIAENSM